MDDIGSLHEGIMSWLVRYMIRDEKSALESGFETRARFQRRIRMKIGMDSFRPQNTVQTEQTPSESPAVITTPKTSDALQFAQDKKLAENKKNEQAMFVSLQQAMLGAELIKTGGIAAPVVTPPAATPPPVGTETSEKIGSPVVSNDVLGPGSPPAQVKAFQVELNEWRAANGLPRIEANGIYSPETTQAVQDFQNATGLAADGMAGGNTKARLALENDPAFGSLKTIVKDEIRDTMNK
jgi:Putative peptidoglycan binding domain